MITVFYLHPSSEISGGERSLLALWSQLDRSIYRPIVFLPGPGPLVREAARMGVDVVFFPVPSLRTWSGRSFWQAEADFRNLICEYKADIIHAYSPRNNILAVRAGWSRGVRVIWHERNIPVGYELDISRLLCRWPDALICNSHAVAARFPEQENIRVIHNGVDPDVFTPEGEAMVLPEGLTGPVVGVVANLSPRKGLETFIEMAAGVCKDIPAAAFLIVGGEYGSASAERAQVLRAYVDRAGLSARIHWTGFRHDIAACLRRMDVLCHPTVREACSRAVLEAMSCAKPVVAFQDGGMPELVVDGQTGLLLPSGDRQGLSRAVTSLLQNVSRAAAMGQAARARVLYRFTVQQNAALIMALYQELVSGERKQMKGLAHAFGN